MLKFLLLFLIIRSTDSEQKYERFLEKYEIKNINAFELIYISLRDALSKMKDSKGFRDDYIELKTMTKKVFDKINESRNIDSEDNQGGRNGVTANGVTGNYGNGVGSNGVSGNPLPVVSESPKNEHSLKLAMIEEFNRKRQILFLSLNNYLDEILSKKGLVPLLLRCMDIQMFVDEWKYLCSRPLTIENHLEYKIHSDDFLFFLNVFFFSTDTSFDIRMSEKMKAHQPEKKEMSGVTIALIVIVSGFVLLLLFIGIGILINYFRRKKRPIQE